MFTLEHSAHSRNMLGTLCAVREIAVTMNIHKQVMKNARRDTNQRSVFLPYFYEFIVIMSSFGTSMFLSTHLPMQAADIQVGDGPLHMFYYSVFISFDRLLL